MCNDHAKPSFTRSYIGRADRIRTCPAVSFNAADQLSPFLGRRVWKAQATRTIEEFSAWFPWRALRVTSGR